MLQYRLDKDVALVLASAWVQSPGSARPVVTIENMVKITDVEAVRNALMEEWQAALTQEPEIVQLLPFADLETMLAKLHARFGSPEDELVKDPREIIFEPSREEILAELAALYVKQEIYQLILESQASDRQLEEHPRLKDWIARGYRARWRVGDFTGYERMGRESPSPPAPAFP